MGSFVLFFLLEVCRRIEAGQMPQCLGIIQFVVVLALCEAKKPLNVKRQLQFLTSLLTGQPGLWMTRAGSLPSRIPLLLSATFHLLLLKAKTEGSTLLSQPKGKRRESRRGGKSKTTQPLVTVGLKQNLCHHKPSCLLFGTGGRRGEGHTDPLTEEPASAQLGSPPRDHRKPLL